MTSACVASSAGYGGTPGETTTRSNPSSDVSWDTTSMPSARTSSDRSARGFWSTPVTFAPRRTHNRTAEAPLAPNPTTATRLPERSTGSPQLQARQGHQGQQNGDDPEAHDDLWLGPPLLLVVMVDGRHQEHPPPEELEAQDLDDDAAHLEEE